MNDMLDALKRQLDQVTTRMAIDPDGELAQTAAMLRLKRGCRR
jgi:hypothetical protein